MGRDILNYLTIEKNNPVQIRDHMTCVNYSQRASDSLVEIVELKEGAVYKRSQEYSEIAFITKGRLRLSSKETIRRVIQEGEIAFLPIGFHFTMEAETDIFIFICKLSREIRFCELLRLEDLDKYAKDVKEEFNTLTILPPVCLFLNSFIPCVNDKLLCKYYISLKINELIFLFRAYYTKEQIVALFFPYIGIDYQFRNAIYNNALISSSIAKLATLSNMSVNGFLHRFKRLMGCKPSEFINKEKAKHIRYNLMCSDTPIQELGERFGFEVEAAFTNFCKKYLGKTPGQFRAEL